MEIPCVEAGNSLAKAEKKGNPFQPWDAAIDGRALRKNGKENVEGGGKHATEQASESVQENSESGRIESEILETGNSNEASEEHAKEPSIRIVDAEEENRETDKEKEGGKESAQVVSRNDKNALADTAGIRSAEDGVELSRLRLASAANGEVDRIARNGVLPKIIEGIIGSEIDTVEADDLITGKQASLVGRTAALHVVNQNAGAGRVENGVASAIKANLYRMAGGVTNVVHPEERVERGAEAKNDGDEIK